MIHCCCILLFVYPRFENLLASVTKIAGFMKITNNDNVKSLCLFILRSSVPTINAEDVNKTRLVHKRNTENSNSKLGYSSNIIV